MLGKIDIILLISSPYSQSMNHLNSQKGIAPIIAVIVLAVVLAGVGGAYFFKQQQAKQVSKANVADATASWKTYANTQYGFEVKYPADTQCGQFSENSNGDFNFGRIEIAVLFPEGLDLNSFVDSYLSRNVSGEFNTVESKKQVKINAGDAIKVAYRFGGTNRYGEVTFLENKRNVYGIGYTAGGFDCNEPQIFSQMLSTFKFTDQTSDTTDPLPIKVGQCSKTTVSRVETRLVSGTPGHYQNVPGSGSAIVYANGGYQVSYDTIQGIEDSHAGDEVNLCLLSIPTDCPAGDNRGRYYGATNLRTGESWEARDAQHLCGGA